IQDWPLLDMSFQVAKDLSRSVTGFVQASGIQTEAPQCLAQGYPMDIRALHKGRIQPTACGEAAQIGCTEANAFFLAKPEHVDCEGQTLAGERLCGSDAQENPKNAVILAGVGNGVEV